MKKIILAISLVTVGLLATTDFSQMTTDELIAMRGTVAVEDRDAFRTELQSRLSTMTAQERDALKASRQTTGRGTAQGAKGGKANAPTFESIDADGDGKITQAELDAIRESRMEANSADGKLLKNVGTAPDLSTIDTNGDGVIDSTEFQTYQTSNMNNNASQRGQHAQSIKGNISQRMGGHGRH
ncbi:MAG: DUF1104 domain-containing protein [Epsilonproteobacteria bacterium]|nr:DUF1104 domain-containing protein [Campylobacterota bacterium]